MATTKKTPKDHLPAAGEPVIVEVGDREIQAPRLNIKSGWIRRHRHLSELDLTYAMLEEFLDEETLALTDEMEQKELQEFMKNWQDASGSNVGE